MVAASADTTTNDQQHLHTEVHPKRTNGNQPAVHSLWRQRPALAYRSASQICDAAVVPCNGQVVTCNSQLAVDGWVAFPFVWWNQVLNHVAYARKKKSQLHLAPRVVSTHEADSDPIIPGCGTVAGDSSWKASCTNLATFKVT